ncbi:hypothetical protein E2C01_050377 [Portunus trituberculatus]|uniref:Uncharacterized protein n=1 Tax=Portunus trituberculatus TaxID=210409 RepID=A0A5B7GFR8_PORTR|nr:hypothetical protein [Portunus trituberculatus]
MGGVGALRETHQTNQGERRGQTGPGDGRAPPEGAGRLLAGGVYRWPRHLHIREHRQFPRPPPGTLIDQWRCPGLSSPYVLYHFIVHIHFLSYPATL